MAYDNTCKTVSQAIGTEKKDLTPNHNYDNMNTQLEEQTCLIQHRGHQTTSTT